MGVIEKTATSSALDLDRFRLRRFVEELGADEVETRADPIDLADVAAELEGNARAVHFKAAGPEHHELVGNVNASRARLARAFDVPPA